MKLKRTLILDIIEQHTSRQQAEDRLVELQNLIKTAGGIVVEKIIQKRRRPSAKTFLGTGKIQEASDYAKTHKIDLVIMNGMLKPNQYLHLQQLFPKVKVWDRTDLILNIFDRHASSKLAKLQIELAKMKQEIPKIYARQATTLFERAGAGIGTRGMGEKGIEAEKRHIRQQIKQMEQKIDAVQQVQRNQRQHRERTGMPTVALVGYTNAGKSSLMQILTQKKGVVASDALFQTLDTKIGKTWLPDVEKEVLVADTIGFIEDLPPNLITSFMTTLQEAREADLLLHVVDASDSKFLQKIHVVDTILQELKCEEIPKVYIFNKWENVSSLPIAAKSFFTPKDPFCTSCYEQFGIEELKLGISEFL